MVRPKIAITKKVTLDEEGHYRFYATGYNIEQPEVRPKAIIFNLNNVTEYRDNGEPYPILNIETEKQLVTFIRDNFGYGVFRIIAYQKGRRGSWTFWKGEISEDGWMFYEKSFEKSEIRGMQKEMEEAERQGDDRTVEKLKEDISNEIAMAREDRKEVKYGFYPHLRRSGRRGEFHSWEEPDEAYEEYYQEEHQEESQENEWD